MRALAPGLALLVLHAATACAPAVVAAKPAAEPPRPAAARDGQRDFDFELGTWTTSLRRLLRPLSGSTEWVEYSGTSVVRKVWDGRANLLELEVDGPAGHLEGLSLRLYDPATKTWSLNFANSRSGEMSPPSIGAFANGRGEFFSRETLGDRPILVRFVISEIAEGSCTFEQAFSADGGKTWEVNWIAHDRRAGPATAAPRDATSPSAP